MKRTLFEIVLGLVVLILALLLIQQVNKPKRSTIEQKAKEMVSAEVERVNTKIDKMGMQHAVTDEKEKIVSSLSNLDDSSRYWKERFLEQAGINEKNVKLMTTYETTIKGMKLSASRTDTGFYYSDKWANIQYVRPKDTADNGHFNFSYNAEINYAEYWKRSHFLAPKKHYIDFWINDPRAKINGVKRLQIESKEPKFRLESSSMVLYDGQTHIGGDIGVSLGNVRVGTSYLYNAATGEWKPYFYGKYKLIGF
ncbi:hypothetical protein BWD42_04000 [Sphingobacterium sp. CZ-UAM]|uniref:hypothetical protein n=1 Tax=Sphingobacterium sp. CZ-UAM TaxID=1933868 RepID=UPI00098510FE|nr:hypothetical protein [Sphingobacterium sp. CZ-UAM]OOG19120.1 hypothetical protein BWD42_04000 [Sphingobacterium sp. CZ-UAM]